MGEIVIAHFGMGDGVHCAPTEVLYVDGVELGTFDEIQFTPDDSEDFGGKMIDTRISGTFTVSVDYIEKPQVAARPPKRPPDPERPMWVRDPATTRRTAYGPTRRVK